MAVSETHVNPTTGRPDDDPGRWKLQPPFNLRLIGVLLFLSILLGYSAQQNELTMLAGHTVVMRYGQVVETGLTDQILEDPQHAYTQELIGAAL